MAERIEDPKYLYIVDCGGSWIKVGKSRNPKQRMKDMQTDNPHPLHLIDQFQCNDKYPLEERNLRHFLAGPRLNKEDIFREWMRIPSLRPNGGFQKRLRYFKKAYEDQNELALDMILKLGWTWFANANEERNRSFLRNR